jgi:hypothetical protein
MNPKIDRMLQKKLEKLLDNCSGGALEGVQSKFEKFEQKTEKKSDGQNLNAVEYYGF